MASFKVKFVEEKKTHPEQKYFVTFVRKSEQQDCSYQGEGRSPDCSDCLLRFIEQQ